MLARIRQFAKSWVALVLIGLLILSFAVIQGNDTFQSSGGTWVVKAGDREITGPEFNRMFDNYKAQLQEQTGQPIANADAVQRGLHLQISRSW
jgi:peptidyl-prolyl cis-trans isomerase D